MTITTSHVIGIRGRCHGCDWCYWRGGIVYGVGWIGIRPRRSWDRTAATAAIILTRRVYGSVVPKTAAIGAYFPVQVWGYIAATIAALTDVGTLINISGCAPFCEVGVTVYPSTRMQVFGDLVAAVPLLSYLSGLSSIYGSIRDAYIDASVPGLRAFAPAMRTDDRSASVSRASNGRDIP